jgi:CIC family chloride channel protein
LNDDSANAGWVENVKREANWCIAVVVIGALGGLLGIIVRFAVVRAWELAGATGVWWAWPIAGGLVASVVIFKFERHAAAEGMPEYIEALNRREGKMRWTLPAAKGVATFFTVGLGGSGGLVGPASLIGGGTGSIIGAWLKRIGMLRSKNGDEIRLAAVCGFAGMLSGMFGLAFAGGIFAAEVLYARMLRYRDIFPGLGAGVVGYLVHGLARGSFSPLLHRVPFTVSPKVFAAALLTALLAAGVGICFVWLFQSSKRVFKKSRIPAWLTPAIGAGISVAAAAATGRHVLGLGIDLIDTLGDGRSVMLVFALTLLAGKLIATTATVGSGGSGGLVFPLIIMGGALGQVVAAAFGVDDPGMRVALSAAGISGLLSAAINVPLASVVLVAELFGVSYLIPAVIGSLVGYTVAIRYLAYEEE